MTQNSSDVEIANQGFAAFRQDLNDVLEDITTLHSGAAAPSTTYANQWWYETDTDKLYIRNEDNDAWIEILTLDQANDHLATIGASITLDGTGNVSIDSGDFTVDTNTLHVDSTNNRVGIGTSLGANKLEVSGAVVAQGAATAYTNTGLYLQNKGSSVFDVGAWRSGASAAVLSFSTDAGSDAAPVERMRIASGGNVGIGALAPSQKLHVESGEVLVQSAYAASTPTSSKIYFAARQAGNWQNTFIGNFGNSLTFGTGGTGTTHTNATERMRIDSGGRLLVNGSSNLYNQNIAQFTSGSATWTTMRNIDTGSAQQYTMVFARNNSNVGAISTTNSSTIFTSISDYRLKENAVAMTGAITRVKSLQPKRFNFIADDSTTVDGFLAHEAQTVVPEAVTGTQDETRSVTNAVLSADGSLLAEDILQADWTAGKLATTDDDGNAVDALYPSDSTWTASHNEPVYQGIDQAKLVPLLTAALQEAITKIETLETKVAALEAE